MKNPIGNQVDRYKRNKEFGQEVNEWLAQRKEQKSKQLSKEKDQKIRKDRDLCMRYKKKYLPKQSL